MVALQVSACVCVFALQVGSASLCSASKIMEKLLLGQVAVSIPVAAASGLIQELVEVMLCKL